MPDFKISTIKRFPSLTYRVNYGNISNMKFNMPDLKTAVSLINKLLPDSQSASDLKIITSRNLDFSMFGDKAPYLMGEITQTSNIALSGSFSEVEIESFLIKNWGNFMYLTAKGIFYSSDKTFFDLTIDAVHQELVLE